MRIAAVLAGLALLAACNNKSTDAGQTAAVPVLQGSVSDTMLPIDKVTSEPPLAPPEEQGDTTGKDITARTIRPSGPPSAEPSAAPSAPSDTPTETVGADTAD